MKIQIDIKTELKKVTLTYQITSLDTKNKEEIQNILCKTGWVLKISS